MTSWLKTKLGGRFRVSTLVLTAAFVALFWVQQSVQPAPAPEAPDARRAQSRAKTP